MVTLIWPISQSFDRKKDWHPQRKVELHLESAFDLSCNINTFPSLMPTCYLVDFEFISFNRHANQFLKIRLSLSPIDTYPAGSSSLDNSDNHHFVISAYRSFTSCVKYIALHFLWSSCKWSCVFCFLLSILHVCY